MSDQTEDQDQASQEDEAPVEAAEANVDAEQDADVELTDEQKVKQRTEKLKESLGITVEDIGTLRQRITLTVPAAIIEDRLDEQFSELQRESDVPGFRTGRAPRRLVEKRFGSEVRNQLKQQLIGEAYLAGTEKEDIQVLGDPDLDFDKIELPDEGDLEFSCEVEVKPEFELPELKGIPVRKPTVTITDEDVDQQIQRIQTRYGNFEPVDDGAVQADDMVVADVKLSVDGNVVSEESNAQFAVRPSRIEGIVVEKLGEALTGAKVDDERSVEAAVPDDYENRELRGKTAQFDFKIRDIKRQVLPPLNDEFAQTVGFDTVDELRTMIRAESESRIDQEIQRGMRAQVRQYLLDNTQLDIPPGLSSRQTARAVQRRVVELQRQGVPDSEVQKHIDELETSAREQVASESKMFFILEKLAEQFDVDVTEEEINGQVAQIAQASNRRLDRVRDELMRRGALQSLYVTLREEKCIDRLLGDAKVAEVTPEQAEAEQQAAQGAAAGKDQADGDLADET